MIRKSLLVLLMLLAAYSLLAAQVIPAAWKTPESQGGDNRLRAQHFLYDHGPDDRVIAGSSLARRLRTELMPGRFVNLSLGGLSVFDGLEILARSGAAPPLVLVEVNVADRRAHSDFLQSLFAPGLYQARRVLPALREENRPVAVTTAGIRHMARRGAELLHRARRPHAVSSVGISTAVKHPPGPPSAVFENMLAKHRKQYALPPDPERLATATENLKRLTEILTARGSRVVLFEMPVHESLCGSLYLTTVRNTLRGALPELPYLEVTPGLCRQYTTTDGHHLDRESAVRFTRHLSGELAARGLL